MKRERRGELEEGEEGERETNIKKKKKTMTKEEREREEEKEKKREEKLFLWCQSYWLPQGSETKETDTQHTHTHTQTEREREKRELIVFLFFPPFLYCLLSSPLVLYCLHLSSSSSSSSSSLFSSQLCAVICHYILPKICQLFPSQISLLLSALCSSSSSPSPSYYTHGHASAHIHEEFGSAHLNAVVSVLKSWHNLRQLDFAKLGKENRNLRLFLEQCLQHLDPQLARDSFELLTQAPRQSQVCPFSFFSLSLCLSLCVCVCVLCISISYSYHHSFHNQLGAVI